MWKVFAREFRTLALWQKSLFLIVILGFALFVGAHRHGKAITLPPAMDCANSTTKKSVALSMNDEMIAPKNPKINVCDTLIITNDSSNHRQPALGTHPNHLEYPGYEAESAITPGSTYSIQLVHFGRFVLHDHINPSIKVLVTVSK